MNRLDRRGILYAATGTVLEGRPPVTALLTHYSFFALQAVRYAAAASVEEPQRDRQRDCVEEVGPDGDDDVDAAVLDQLATNVEL